MDGMINWIMTSCMQKELADDGRVKPTVFMRNKHT